MLTIHLPRDLEERLDAAARRAGRTKATLAREAIAERIGDLEARYLTYATVEGFTVDNHGDAP